MNSVQYVRNHIDFILWKFWDPIGDGQLGIPRNEYSGYTDSIVNLKLARKSQEDIASWLDKCAVERMGLRSNIEHSLETAERIVAIPDDGKLRPIELEDYLDVLEESQVDVFEAHGFPTTYYFYELIDMRDQFRTIPRSKIHSFENYQVRWRELIDQGHPWINLAPMGYLEQAFV